MAVKEKMIVIERPQIEKFDFKIRSMVGSTMLQNRFTEESAEDIKNKQTGEKGGKKKFKNTEKIFEAKKYKDKKGRLGVPANALKMAMVNAAKISGESMTDMRKGFHVIGSIIPFDKNSKPKIHEDFLPINGGGRNYTVRCELETWELTVPIQFNSNFISAEQLLNLASLAGFHCGLLDYRPFSKKCSGNHGMYEVVETVKKAKKKRK
jgi:hypothetical protein